MKLRNILSAPAILATTVCILAGHAHARFNPGVEATPEAPVALVPADTTDRLIIKYRKSQTANTALRSRHAVTVAGNRQGVLVSEFRRLHNGDQVLQLSRRMQPGELDNLIQSLRTGDANIEYAEPDRILQPLYVPNDRLYPQQWALSDATAGIRAPAAWDRTTGTGVTIAVIDTGVRRHADLAANLLPGYDFVTSPSIGADGGGRDADATDPGDAAPAGACGVGSAASNSSWHGTHVAGLIAAAGGNGVGVTGVAFGARILPLRAMGRCGGYTSDVADAIVWAAGGSVGGMPLNTNPAKVINLSLGGAGTCGITSQNAINAARAKGATVVVAAGNANSGTNGISPANCAGVIAVAATGRSGGKAWYSSFGSHVAVAAPGGESGAGLLSTLNAGSSLPGADSYAYYMGTSMAAPMVSGVAALMLSVNPTLTPDQVALLLKSSARPFPALCSGCGAGLVDAHAAVSQALAARGTTPTPPAAPAPAPAAPQWPVASSNATAIKEAEPNNSIAAAQVIASAASVISGAIGNSADSDYYRFSVAPGSRVTLTMTAGAASGFGLGIYTTSGRLLLLNPGVTGRQQRMTVSNSGSGAAWLVVRVLRTTGNTGSYKLGLSS